MAEEGAPAVATAYLELLYQVLEEGVLTQAEAQSLVEVADYLLTADQFRAQSGAAAVTAG